MILVSYDVSTASPEGRKRLRHVAKICLDYGQRVQNSVFECYLDHAQLQYFRKQLLGKIDQREDSLRFYVMGNNWERKVEHFGVKPSINFQDDTLIV
jgi:CRISPR-associated protein Cas2